MQKKIAWQQQHIILKSLALARTAPHGVAREISQILNQITYIFLFHSLVRSTAHIQLIEVGSVVYVLCFLASLEHVLVVNVVVVVVVVVMLMV